MGGELCFFSLCVVPLMGGGYLQLHKTSASFDEANQRCSYFGMSLATLTSDVQDTFTAFALQSQDSSSSIEQIWIGLLNPAGSSEWQWMNGNVANWTYWDGELHDHQRCAALTKEGSDYVWRVLSCEEERPYLCLKGASTEVDVVSETLLGVTVTSEQSGPDPEAQSSTVDITSSLTQLQTDLNPATLATISHHATPGVTDFLENFDSDIITKLDGITTVYTHATPRVTDGADDAFESTPGNTDFLKNSGTNSLIRQRSFNTILDGITKVYTDATPQATEVNDDVIQSIGDEPKSNKWNIDWDGMKIDKYKSTKYMRKLNCASDSRLSAKSIGIIAIVVNVMVIVGILILDIDNLRKSLRLVKRNLKSCYMCR